MAGVTNNPTKNPKAAKRGTYTLHPSSIDVPKDQDGNPIQYVHQEFPKLLVHPDSIANPKMDPHDKYRRCENAIEEAKYRADGYATALEHRHNGKVIDFEETVGEAATDAPEKTRKKPGPKPKEQKAA